MTPDEWGAENREYPNTSGYPGKRNPALTPYVIEFERAVHRRTHKKVVFSISAQSGKTEALFDIVGERLDTAPVPILYVGPTRPTLVQQIEPRIQKMLEEVPSLSRKLRRGRKMSTTLKHIAGVPLRLAHGGSSAALKSDPFGLAVTDEADELMANVKNAGDPIVLIDARGDSYADFVHVVVSTPSEGPNETEIDEESGLEFWLDDIEKRDQINSTIWGLWLSGTQYHWAWPCPHCGEYFIPRLKNLKWDKPQKKDGTDDKSTPEMAQATARIQCPQGCSDPILNHHKEEMNRRGVYVAPGQSILPDGTVIGEAPDRQTISFWVSGLASPFKTFGDRASSYVTAVRSGKPSSVKAAINSSFGELYSPAGGAVPDWKDLEKLRCDYLMKPPGQDTPPHVPGFVRLITMAVDVQKSGLYFTVRGWGARAKSALITAGFLQGETAGPDVWKSLEGLMSVTYNAMPVRLVLLDSGYRPGKKFELPINRIYEFARKHHRIVRATKGSSKPMTRPIVSSRIDVNANGKLIENALELYRLDTDVWKQWVQERLTWDPEDTGGWQLPMDVSEDYLQQMVSEARLVLGSGKVRWIQKAKNNHYFDCESMQAAAGSMINAILIREDADDGAPAPRTADKQTENSPRSSEGWVPRESIWR